MFPCGKLELCLSFSGMAREITVSHANIVIKMKTPAGLHAIQTPAGLYAIQFPYFEIINRLFL